VHSAIIHGRFLITNRDEMAGPVIADGAVYQVDGVIMETGDFRTLRARHPQTAVIGGINFAVLPGFVNAHHHGHGLSSLRQGRSEGSLEQKLFRGLARRRPDPYANNLLACARMISSGVTCSLHHAYADGTPESYLRAMRSALRAHEQAGMRVGIALAARDQNTLVYGDEARFLNSLPEDLQGQAEDLARGKRLRTDEYIEIYRQLAADHRESKYVRVLLGPAGLQWCSDGLLGRIARVADETGGGIHLHAVESIYQREYARRRFGRSAIAHLRELGILGPNTSLAHSVWVTDDDLETLADTHTMVVHNPSSNLRSACGVAPVVPMLRRGLRVALGMDGSTLNDDDDMLQEIRLALRLHRPPGISSSRLTPAQIFRMATVNGARAAQFGGLIGQIQSGMQADLVLIDLDPLPDHVFETLGVLQSILWMSKSSHVDTVLIGGQVVMRDGQLIGIDVEALEKEVLSQARSEPDPEQRERSYLVAKLEPHLADFYQDWWPEGQVPYYGYNSRR
jgi:cytosine/adenosine deaminase-related metal-dependent hydrolase